MPLHEFVALVTHLAELDDQARQLGLVNWAIKDTAITRIVDLAVSGGMLAKDVPTFAVWVQSAVRFRAEADAATLEALQLSDVDFFAAQVPWPSAAGTVLPTEVSEVWEEITWGGETGLVPAGASSARAASPVMLAIGPYYLTVHCGTNQRGGKALAQVLHAFERPGGAFDAAMHALAFVEQNANAEWPAGMDSFESLLLRMRADMAERAAWASMPTALTFNKKLPGMCSVLGDFGKSLHGTPCSTARAAVEALGRALGVTFGADHHANLVAVARAANACTTISPRAASTAVDDWVAEMVEKVESRKREREETPLVASSGKVAKGDESGSASGGGVSRAFLESFNQLKDGSSFNRMHDLLMQIHSKLGTKPGLDQAALLYAQLTARTPEPMLPEDPALRERKIKEEEAIVPMPLFQQLWVGRFDPAVLTPSLHFLSAIQYKKAPDVFAQLVARTAVRVYRPSGATPACLVNLKLNKLAAALAGGDWRKELDFFNDMDAPILAAFQGLEVVGLPKCLLYMDHTQNARVAEAAQEIFSLLNFRSSVGGKGSSVRSVLCAPGVISKLHVNVSPDAQRINREHFREYTLASFDNAQRRLKLVWEAATPDVTFSGIFQEAGGLPDKALLEHFSECDVTAARRQAERAEDAFALRPGMVLPALATAVPVAPGMQEQVRQAASMADAALGTMASTKPMEVKGKAEVRWICLSAKQGCKCYREDEVLAAAQRAVKAKKWDMHLTANTACFCSLVGLGCNHNNWAGYHSDEAHKLQKQLLTAPTLASLERPKPDWHGFF